MYPDMTTPITGAHVCTLWFQINFGLNICLYLKRIPSIRGLSQTVVIL